MSPTADSTRLLAASVWKTALYAVVLALAVALMSCGGAAEEAASEGVMRESLGLDTPRSRLAQLMPGGASPDSASGAPGSREVVVEKEVVKEVEVINEVPTQQTAIAESGRRESATLSDTSGPGVASKIRPSMVAQNRIIVHTGHVTLVVSDVAQAVEQVSDLAVSYGGWVVGSDRSSRHSGSVSIRVPAESLQKVLDELDSLAIEVESLALTSQDVTDEFVDTRSRLASLRVTEQVHLQMLSKAQDVEEALMVQDRISDIQIRIEQMQGRINYLSQVAAFSLVNVNLKLSTAAMPVDTGDNTAFRIGQLARFQANFTPPPGIDDFTFTWDFGDGSTASRTQTAPVVGSEGERVTASVSHVYGLEGDYIAEVKIAGKGDAGLADGSDTVIVNITEVPTIEVFAGENLVAEEGEELAFRATFTRPPELWDYEYRWDFGDGTPTEIGVPDEGATRVGTVHRYADYRRDPYEVTFTMSAMSEAGKVSTTANFFVVVTESRGLIIGGWSAGETGKTAIRSLSVVLQVLATLAIWLAVFSPVWLLIAAVAFGIIYLRRRLRSQNARSGHLSGFGDQPDAPPDSPEASQEGFDEDLQPGDRDASWEQPQDTSADETTEADASNGGPPETRPR